MNFTYRPLPAVWPSGERTPQHRRKRATFRASWPATIELLQRELRQLGVSAWATVVVEAGYRERDIRLDGLPRADARFTDPAVVISFESKHGPLRYGCDTFTDHQDNVRAIALALEALRAVDRYGVSNRGEQYRGWAALPSPAMTKEKAKHLLERYGGEKAALHATHPDKGGNPEAFHEVQLARQILGMERSEMAKAQG